MSSLAELDIFIYLFLAFALQLLDLCFIVKFLTTCCMKTCILTSNVLIDSPSCSYYKIHSYYKIQIKSII